MWAQPSIDHLRKLMRFVVENPDKAKEVLTSCFVVIFR